MNQPTPRRYRPAPNGFTRRGFTLVELLVVVGIIAILIGILFPVIHRSMINADIASQKSDFQTIMTAIANYKNDFGVIPQNISQNQAPHNPNNPTPLRLYTLASALIGPGPAVTGYGTQTIGGSKLVIAGDGADGYGFRASAQPFPTTVTGATAGATTVNIATSPGATLPLAWGNPTAYWPGTPSNPTPVYITFSPGSPNATFGNPPTNVEESVGAYVPGPLTLPLTVPLTVTLTAPLQYTHSSVTDYVAIIHTLNSKVWSSYLPADKFKVAYYPYLNSSGNLAAPNLPIWPELLDRWGNPIQYFTRFAPNSNRIGDSQTNGNATSNQLPPNITPTTAIKAGPLIGVSTPGSVEIASGVKNDPEPDNAIWDYRDASIAMQPPSVTAAAAAAGTGPDPWIAIRWMLGDDPISQAAYVAPGNDNYITGSERVFDGDYFLLSVGPVNDTYGFPAGLCNLANLPGNMWKPTFDTSANVYSFDKP